MTGSDLKIGDKVIRTNNIGFIINMNNNLTHNRLMLREEEGIVSNISLDLVEIKLEDNQFSTIHKYNLTKKEDFELNQILNKIQNEII